MAPEYAILKKFEQLHTSTSVNFPKQETVHKIEWLTQGHSAISHKMSLELTAFQSSAFSTISQGKTKKKIWNLVLPENKILSSLNHSQSVRWNIP